MCEIKNGVIGFEMSLIQLPHACDKNVKRISKLASNSSSSRGFGSAALSLCYLARGSIDCFHVEDLKSWDIAGGAIIVLEAGGVIHHTSGAEFKVMKPDCVVAATSELAKEVIQLILEADQITEFTFK